jgi:hypothetical protein
MSCGSAELIDDLQEGVGIWRFCSLPLKLSIFDSPEKSKINHADDFEIDRQHTKGRKWHKNILLISKLKVRASPTYLKVLREARYR